MARPLLTDEQIGDIRLQLGQGRRPTHVARDFGVSYDTVWRIRKGTHRPGVCRQATQRRIERKSKPPPLIDEIALERALSGDAEVFARLTRAESREFWRHLAQTEFSPRELAKRYAQTAGRSEGTIRRRIERERAR